MDLSVDLRVVRDACTNYFASFKGFCASGTQDAEVTKSLIQYNIHPVLNLGSIQVPGKLPTYPSSIPTFCPK